MDVRCKLAHDLNNSFAVISGHIDFLSDTCPPDPEIAAHLGAIREALKRAANLVHDCQCAMAFDDYMTKPSGRNNGNGRAAAARTETSLQALAEFCTTIVKNHL